MIVIVCSILLYIFLGFLIFIVCKQLEDDAEYTDPEWYNSFYKKSRSYRIVLRLFAILFWPLVAIVMCLAGLYAIIIYFYKNLIK